MSTPTPRRPAPIAQWENKYRRMEDAIRDLREMEITKQEFEAIPIEYTRELSKNRTKKAVDLEKIEKALAYMTAVIQGRKPFSITTKEYKDIDSIHKIFSKTLKELAKNMDEFDAIIKKARADGAKAEIPEKHLQELDSNNQKLLSILSEQKKGLMTHIRAFREERLAEAKQLMAKSHKSAEPSHLSPRSNRPLEKGKLETLRELHDTKRAERTEREKTGQPLFLLRANLNPPAKSDEDKASIEGVKWFSDFIDAYKDALNRIEINPTLKMRDKGGWDGSLSNALGKFAYDVYRHPSLYSESVSERVGIAMEYFGGLRGLSPKTQKENLLSLIEKQVKDSPLKEMMAELKKYEQDFVSHHKTHRPR
jgi:hypothetical protein